METLPSSSSRASPLLSRRESLPYSVKQSASNSAIEKLASHLNARGDHRPIPARITSSRDERLAGLFPRSVAFCRARGQGGYLRVGNELESGSEARWRGVSGRGCLKAVFGASPFF